MKSQSITHCQHCDKPFTTTADEIRRGRGKYCSHKCHSLAQKGTGKPVAERFWPKVRKTESCWLWTGATVNGYGRFNVEDKSRLAPRVAWELTNGPIPDGMFVCHNCPGGDNPLCVNPAHLFLGTQFDNMRDCSAKGHNGTHTHPETIRRGTANGQAKLTEDDVREIRRLSAEGVYQREIGKRFGIAHCTVGRIVHGSNWQHVE